MNSSPGVAWPPWGARVAAGLAALAFLPAIAVLAGGALLLEFVPRGFAAPQSLGVSSEARADIPADYLRLYLQAADRYGLDWSILAAIGKVECDHGRDPDPSCTQEGATNSAGAGGPAQFLADTWAQYGVDADHDGTKDRWSAADAIFGMANDLRASGAPADYHRAIYAYNHAEWYVAEVLHWASVYRAAAGSQIPQAEQDPSQARPDHPQDLSPLELTAGGRATLSPHDGHVALAPLDAPEQVDRMLLAGNELQRAPYGPDGHPDPRGARDQDCSSSVNYVLYRAGVRSIGEIVRSNPLAQDYPRWGLPGPGRWVTIYATTSPSDHVFIVIAGLRLDTSHHGTDVGPNRDQDGPRWRILDHIPTWAHWVIRHPPGL